MAGFFKNMAKMIQSKYSKIEAEKPFFEDVQQKAERYIEDRLLLMKLQATEKIALFSPKIILALVLLFVVFFIILVATFMLCYFLAIQTNSVLVGCGIVLAFFIGLFFLIIWRYKTYYRQRLSDLIVKLIFSNSNEEVNHE